MLAPHTPHLRHSAPVCGAVGQDLGLHYGSSPTAPTGKFPTVFAQGECDDIFLELMTHLGWLDDLEPLIELLPEKSVARLRRAIALQRGEPLIE